MIKIENKEMRQTEFAYQFPEKLQRTIYAYFNHLVLINGSAKFQNREFPTYANLLISKAQEARHRRTANIFLT